MPDQKKARGPPGECMCASWVAMSCDTGPALQGDLLQLHAAQGLRFTARHASN